MSQFGSMAQVEIIDEDTGVSKEECDRIFEPFYGVDRTKSRTLAGTSLGFVILKHIAQAHMRRVSVNINFEKGSASIVQILLADKVAWYLAFSLGLKLTCSEDN